MSCCPRCGAFIGFPSWLIGHVCDVTKRPIYDEDEKKAIDDCIKDAYRRAIARDRNDSR